MSFVRLEDLSLVEEGVDKMRIVVQAVGQCGVGDLQHHHQNLFQNGTIIDLHDSVTLPSISNSSVSIFTLRNIGDIL